MPGWISQLFSNLKFYIAFGQLIVFYYQAVAYSVGIILEKKLYW